MKRLALGAAFALLPLAQAAACTVCFGGQSSPWNRGFFWAIVLLLSLPFVLMGSLLSLYLYHSRKHRASAPPAQAAAHP